MGPWAMKPRKPVLAEPEQLAAWLRAVAGGDEKAFRSLYLATAPKLYGLLLRILRKEDGAEDALQDVFVSIWQKAGSYAPRRGTPLAWLLSIARHRALDLLRRRRPESSLEDTGGWEQAALTERTALQPERQHEIMEMFATVEQYLGELPPDQRRALLLAYFQGVPYQELAERLGVPEGTVKTWVRRGLLTLRARLAGRKP